jgi:predicted nucleotidyltransferase
MREAASVAEAVRGYFESEKPTGVVSAYLFGSHARGTAHRESDVDVAVLFDYGVFSERGARGRDALRLCAELVAAVHANRVDVVALNDAPPELAAGIVSRGHRLYCADPAGDHAFVRTALLRHADIRPFLDRTRRVTLRALAR